MVDRESRQKDTQEFFTPDHIVQQMLSEAPLSLFPFIESSVGIGNIALAVYDKIKILGMSHEEILESMWLADLQEDNCIETIKQLEKKNNNYHPEITALREKNIPDLLQTNGLKAIFEVDKKIYLTVVQADTTIFNWWRSKNNTIDKWFEDSSEKTEEILKFLESCKASCKKSQ